MPDNRFVVELRKQASHLPKIPREMVGTAASRTQRVHQESRDENNSQTTTQIAIPTSAVEFANPALLALPTASPRARLKTSINSRFPDRAGPPCSTPQSTKEHSSQSHPISPIILPLQNYTPLPLRNYDSPRGSYVLPLQNYDITPTKLKIFAHRIRAPMHSARQGFSDVRMAGSGLMWTCVMSMKNFVNSPYWDERLPTCCSGDEKAAMTGRLLGFHRLGWRYSEL